MTGLIKLEVFYSCFLCGLEKVPVLVPARESPAVDVAKWMEELARLLSQDHAARSPGCRPRELKNIMINMTNAQWVGGPPLD